MERYETAQDVLGEVWNDSGEEHFSDSDNDFSDLRRTLERMRMTKTSTLMIQRVLAQEFSKGLAAKGLSCNI